MLELIDVMQSPRNVLFEIRERRNEMKNGQLSSLDGPVQRIILAPGYQCEELLFNLLLARVGA